ncbi:unnamed protein product [Gongylonema pulchrum]|uniref:Transposase n=1 Tax=Gongylonema pulchrum TaxID=637853 RepID=A0A183E6M5_9BILA|nr:unnamed protein product [Gongylonema pulchrum]
MLAKALGCHGSGRLEKMPSSDVQTIWPSLLHHRIVDPRMPQSQECSPCGSKVKRMGLGQRRQSIRTAPWISSRVAKSWR